MMWRGVLSWPKDVENGLQSWAAIASSFLRRSLIISHELFGSRKVRANVRKLPPTPFRASINCRRPFPPLVVLKMKLFTLNVAFLHTFAIVMCLMARDSAAFVPTKVLNQHASSASTSTRTSTTPFSTQQTQGATTTTLFLKEDNESDYRNSVYGLNVGRGPLILGLAMLMNIWLFSIPVEFRRARFCDEQQTLANPDSKCTTPQAWAQGITQYYRNGGGIQFDFSIEGNE